MTGKRWKLCFKPILPHSEWSELLVPLPMHSLVKRERIGIAGYKFIYNFSCH